MKVLNEISKDVLSDLGAFNPKWGKLILIEIKEASIYEIVNEMRKTALIYETMFSELIHFCPWARRNYNHFAREKLEDPRQ